MELRNQMIRETECYLNSHLPGRKPFWPLDRDGEKEGSHRNAHLGDSGWLRVNTSSLVVKQPFNLSHAGG